MSENYPLHPSQCETELAALRVSLAASQAECVALRGGLKLVTPHAACSEDCPTHTDGPDTCECGCEGIVRAARRLLSTPTGTEALRAMLEKALKAGAMYVANREGRGAPWPCDASRDLAEGRAEEASDPGDPDVRRIVDSILTGGSDGR